MLSKHTSSIPRNMSFVNLLHFMTHVLAAYSISSYPNSLFIPLKYQLVDMVWSLYIITLLQLSRKRSGKVTQTRSPGSSWNMEVKWERDEFLNLCDFKVYVFGMYFFKHYDKLDAATKLVQYGACMWIKAICLLNVKNKYSKVTSKRKNLELEFFWCGCGLIW